jgi:hypothetical protein
MHPPPLFWMALVCFLVCDFRSRVVKLENDSLSELN